MKDLMSKKTVAAVVSLIVLGVVAILALYGYKHNEGVKIANSPLNGYTYFYSLDNYPKIKRDMVYRVEESMATGMSEEEACLEAIDWASDQIYTDALEFYGQYDDGWDAEEPDMQSAEYKQHIEKKFGYKILEVAPTK